MLDSLVRVSRRVGWVTDLLAANRQPPTDRLHDHSELLYGGPQGESVRTLNGEPLSSLSDFLAEETVKPM